MKRLLLPALGMVLGFAFGAFRAAEPDADPAPQTRLGPGKTGAAPQVDGAAAAIAALQSIAKRPALRAFAEIAARLEQLDAKQIGQVLDYLEKQGDSDPYRDAGCVVEWWLKRDPAAASAWVQIRLRRFLQNGPPGMSFGDNEAFIVNAWAQAFPSEALEFARQHPRSGLATKLLFMAARAWPDKDPAARYAIVLSLPGGEARTKTLEDVLYHWTRKEPASALAAAQAFPAGAERDQLVARVLKEWPEKDAAAAFEHYRRLKLSDPELLGQILHKAGTADPEKALRWLEQLEPAEIVRSARAIVDAWAAKDPVAALKWALENGVAVSRVTTEFRMRTEHNGFGRQGSSGGHRDTAPLSSAMKKDPEATLQWIRSLPAGADRQRLTGLAIFDAKAEQKLSLFAELPPEAQPRFVPNIIMSFSEPGADRRWAETLPPGRVREAAWRAVGSRAAEPLDMPPGPDRDAMLHGRVMGSGVRVAEQSLELTLQIGNPIQRRDAFDDAMEYYSRGFLANQGDAARAWMETADLPEEWKQPWRGGTPAATPR